MLQEVLQREGKSYRSEIGIYIKKENWKINKNKYLVFLFLTDLQ